MVNFAQILVDDRLLKEGHQCFVLVIERLTNS